MHLRPPRSPLFPYTTLFRSYQCRRINTRSVGVAQRRQVEVAPGIWIGEHQNFVKDVRLPRLIEPGESVESRVCCRKFLERSEEHTSELQSLAYLVCRLLLEK